jgi:hypothetical protein
MEVEREGESFYFVECDICRNKPGSPELCEACLLNRETFMKLEEILREKA